MDDGISRFAGSCRRVVRHFGVLQFCGRIRIVKALAGLKGRYADRVAIGSAGSALRNRFGGLYDARVVAASDAGSGTAFAIAYRHTLGAAGKPLKLPKSTGHLGIGHVSTAVGLLSVQP